MLTIETKELEISKGLLRKVEMICKFAGVKPTITNGNIKNIKRTNIAYVKPHIVKINNVDYLMFEECDDIFVNGYKERIKFKDFEKDIKHIEYQKEELIKKKIINSATNGIYNLVLLQ